MKKSSNFILTLLFLTLFIPFKVYAFQITDNQTVNSNKTWTIRFTDSVDFDDLTKSSITVINYKNNLVNVILANGSDGKTILVNAPKGGYTVGENYTLNIGTKVHSKKGKSLKNAYNLHFNIKDDTNNSSIVTFRDKNLEQAIRDIINKPTGDIYKSDIVDIKSLDLKNKGIKDLSGIENFSNLVSIDLSNDYTYENDSSNNEISNINSLKGLTKLEILNLKCNPISEISQLSKLVNLKELNLFNDNISNVDVLQNLSNLEKLDLGNYRHGQLYYNTISDINSLKDFKKLTYLNLSFLGISDLTPIKNLDSLTYLNAIFTSVSNLTPLENLTKLNYLDLSYTNVSDLHSLESLKSLTYLNLGNVTNGTITDITPLNNLTNLTNLDICNENINDISTLYSFINLKN